MVLLVTPENQCKKIELGLFLLTDLKSKQTKQESIICKPNN